MASKVRVVTKIMDSPLYEEIDIEECIIKDEPLDPFEESLLIEVEQKSKKKKNEKKVKTNTKTKDFTSIEEIDIEECVIKVEPLDPLYPFEESLLVEVEQKSKKKKKGKKVEINTKTKDFPSIEEIGIQDCTIKDKPLDPVEESLLTKVEPKRKEKGNKARAAMVVFPKKNDKKGTSLLCNLCTRWCDDKDDLIAHFYRYHPTMFYLSCAQCGYAAKDRKALVRHRRRAHETVKKNKCNDCGKAYIRFPEYQAHKRKVHGVRMKPYKCKDCEKRFEKQTDMYKHYNSIHRRLKSECQLCNMEFCHSSSLKRHIDVIHRNIRKYHCNDCGKRFSDKLGLKYHILAVHLHMKPFVCQFCGMKCSAKGNLQLHINAVHLNVKKFMCAECDRGFSQRSSLRYHIKRYSAQHSALRRIYRPRGQGKDSEKRNLQLDIDAVHLNERKYTCAECNRGFTQRNSLIYHIKRYSLNHSALRRIYRPRRQRKDSSTFTF